MPHDLTDPAARKAALKADDPTLRVRDNAARVLLDAATDCARADDKAGMDAALAHIDALGYAASLGRVGRSGFARKIAMRAGAVDDAAAGAAVHAAAVVVEDSRARVKAIRLSAPTAQVVEVKPATRLG